MEESLNPISWKDMASPRKRTDVVDAAGSSNDARSSPAPPKNPSNKFGWKSLIRFFRKSANKKTCALHRNDLEFLANEKEDNEVYLSDVKDELAMAISLPEKMNGKDVQVSIEMKAIEKQEFPKSGSGLKVSGETVSKTTFAGNIKIPSETTIEQVAKMPLYFVNPEKTITGEGEYTNKIETVVKPLESNLPANVDKGMIVTDINLTVNLQNVDNKKCRRSNGGEDQLNYTFISNNINNVARSKSSLHCKADDIVEEISQTNMIYNEQSKAIVKDILSQVMDKVQTHDIATQFSIILQTVNEEIDVQKSLLLKRSSESCSSQLELLSRISEKDEWDNALVSDDTTTVSTTTVYPSSTTTFKKVSTVSITESENSMYYLKAPTNTPNQEVPKYVIRYDQGIENKFRKQEEQNMNKLFYDKKNKVFYHQVLHDDIRADIDRTLELLETAKDRLLSYLDNAMELVDFTREYKYKYQCNGEEKKQFFRGEAKIEEAPDLISFSAESIKLTRVPRLNTLQNIYNGDVLTDCINRSHSQLKYDDVLKQRYSGDCKPNDLAYNIVENDINTMIRDLLRETQNIKELVIDTIAEREEEVDLVVRDVIETLLDGVVEKERVEPLVGALEPPKIHSPAVCINYCLIDEKNPVDTTKALLEPPKKIPTSRTGIVYRPQRHGDQRTTPRVTVKKLNPKKHHILKTEENLVQRLEKGTNFLKNIYSEICSINYDIAQNSPVDLPTNLDEPDPEMTHTNATDVEPAPDQPTNVVETPNNEVCFKEPEVEKNPTAPQGLFLLKKAARILTEELEEVARKSTNLTSQEELVECVYDLIPAIPDKPSTLSNRRPAFHYISSSSEDLIRPRRPTTRLVSKSVSQSTSYANNKVTRPEKDGNSEVSLDSSEPTTITDYEADQEASSYALPAFRYEYESKEDLNNEREIKFIEDNAEANKRMNPPRETFSDFDRALICESFESFTATSLTIDSEASLEETNYNNDTESHNKL